MGEQSCIRFRGGDSIFESPKINVAEMVGLLGKYDGFWGMVVLSSLVIHPTIGPV